MNLRETAASRIPVWQNRDWQQTMNRIDQVVLERNVLLRNVLGGDFHVDEVAILCQSLEHSNAFVRRAVREEGVELFNVASDSVRVQPFGTSYSVDYAFLRTDRSYRLEVMSLGATRGFSPLHAAMWGGDGAPEDGCFELPIVHASFKAQNEAVYDDVVSVLRNHCQHAQTCVSSYGVFSYWLPYGTGSLVFLKPRVNTRDGERGAL